MIEEIMKIHILVSDYCIKIHSKRNQEAGQNNLKFMNSSTDPSL